jgi:hypothetical protein
MTNEIDKRELDRYITREPDEIPDIDELAPSVWRDYCPLCAARFTANSEEELVEKILAHLRPKQETGKSDCEEYFIPFPDALADDCFEHKTGRPL